MRHKHTRVARLTLSSSSVELLHGVVKTDSDGGEAHLPLESCHQSIVKAAGPLCAHHGGDGAKHSPILHCTGPFTLSLNLEDEVTFKNC